MKVCHRINVCAAAVASMMLAGCGGGGSSQGQTPPGGPSNPNAGITTITIRADGTMNPADVQVEVGDRVRFVNEDSRPHQPTSNPHLMHTDCPALNLPQLSPGQAQMTGVLNTVAACGFHDHMNPDTVSLRGTIRVGGAQGPGGPVYVRP